MNGPPSKRPRRQMRKPERFLDNSEGPPPPPAPSLLPRVSPSALPQSLEPRMRQSLPDAQQQAGKEADLVKTAARVAGVSYWNFLRLMPRLDNTQSLAEQAAEARIKVDTEKAVAKAANMSHTTLVLRFGGDAAAAKLGAGEEQAAAGSAGISWTDLVRLGPLAGKGASLEARTAAAARPARVESAKSRRPSACAI